MDWNDLKQTPHRRFNPLTGEGVLVSPQRTQRPWQGKVEKPSPENPPVFDLSCYLCPGNARSGGVRNPNYAGTFVFENDYSALLPDTLEASVDLRQVTVRYDNLFEVAFPYSMGFHQRPADGAPHSEWHLHAHYYPPLLRSAAVQKFMLGYELLGTPSGISPPKAQQNG